MLQDEPAIDIKGSETYTTRDGKPFWCCVFRVKGGPRAG